jgi:hypothetical protein
MAVKFIVTYGYIQYADVRTYPRGDTCEICGATGCKGGRARQDYVFDHCHAHGWVRGITCQPCNVMLPSAETGEVITPRQANHLANCPDCPHAAAWMAVRVRPRCPAGCSNGLLYLRSLGRLVACPACSGG